MIGRSMRLFDIITCCTYAKVMEETAAVMFWGFSPSNTPHHTNLYLVVILRRTIPGYMPTLFAKKQSDFRSSKP